MNNNIKWLWLTLNVGLSRHKIRKLLDDFGSVQNIFEASEKDFSALEYIEDEFKRKLVNKDVSNLSAIEGIMEKYRVRLLTVDSSDYPEDLKQIDDYPVLLYVRGAELDLNDHLGIAMVGTRKPTKYGTKVAESMASEIAEEGALVISGMADGIDTHSHVGALKAGAPTVAILGCGVNMPYPKKNAGLMKRIMENGMVISEYPFNSEPKPWHFPERNRIIAGLSKGTLVVEGEEQSGSLITANYAMEFNRDVFAVPGNIDSLMSKGTNNLIKNGAYAALSAEDVLGHYRDVYGHLLKPVVRTPIDVSDYEEEYENKESAENKISLDGLSDKDKIYACLGADAIHIDVICEMTELSAQAVNSSLLMLELEGKIMSYAGNMYSRKDI